MPSLAVVGILLTWICLMFGGCVWGVHWLTEQWPWEMDAGFRIVLKVQAAGVNWAGEVTEDRFLPARFPFNPLPYYCCQNFLARWACHINLNWGKSTFTNYNCFGTDVLIKCGRVWKEARKPSLKAHNLFILNNPNKNLLHPNTWYPWDLIQISLTDRLGEFRCDSHKREKQFTSDNALKIRVLKYLVLQPGCTTGDPNLKMHPY